MNKNYLKKYHVFVVITVLVITILVIFASMTSDDLEGRENNVDFILEIKNNLKENDKEEAIKNINKALERGQDDPKLIVEIAKITLRLRDYEKTVSILDRALSFIEINKEVAYLFLMAFKDKDEDEKSMRMSALLKKLPDTQENNEFKASVYKDIGNYNSARKIWMSLIKESEDVKEEYILGISRTYLIENNIENAILILNKHISILSDKGKNLLASIYVCRNEYDQIKNENINDDRVFESPEMKLKFSLFDLFVSHDEEALLKVRYYCRSRSEDVSDLAIAHNARLYLAFYRLLTDRDVAQFKDLKMHARKDYRNASGKAGISDLLRLPISQKKVEQEIKFYDLLEAIVENPSNGLKLFEKYKSAMVNHPVVDFLVLKLTLAHGKIKNSTLKALKMSNRGVVSNVEGLHGVLLLSPVVQVEMAKLLHILGDVDNAMSLLSPGFEKGVFTEEMIVVYMGLLIDSGSFEKLALLHKSVVFLNKNKAKKDAAMSVALIKKIRHLLSENKIVEAERTLILSTSRLDKDVFLLAKSDILLKKNMIGDAIHILSHSRNYKLIEKAKFISKRFDIE